MPQVLSVASNSQTGRGMLSLMRKNTAVTLALIVLCTQAGMGRRVVCHDLAFSWPASGPVVTSRTR